VEVWVLFCLASVSGALLEFALVIYKKSPLEQRRRQYFKANIVKMLKPSEASDDDAKSTSRLKRMRHKFRKRNRHTLRKMVSCCNVIKKGFDTHYIGRLPSLFLAAWDAIPDVFFSSQIFVLSSFSPFAS
jgi:hypothetical protein